MASKAFLAMAGGGADDGADVREEVCAPVGTEAAGDFAVGGGGTEFAFGAVVVGRYFGMIEEGQQTVADFAVAFAQSSRVGIVWRERHDFIEVVVEAPFVTSSRPDRRAVAPGRTPAEAMLSCAEQKPYRPPRWQIGVALLRSVEIRHP